MNRWQSSFLTRHFHFTFGSCPVNIVQQGMRDLGDKWFNGEATVQQEHFTSALVLRRLETLIAATPPPIRSQTILIASPSEEWHTFSMVMLNLLLRRRGYHVVFLGANVPNDHLDEATDSIKPDLVVLASQHLTSAANLQKAAQLLLQKNVHVAYGGRVFNSVPPFENGFQVISLVKPSRNR